MSSAAKAAASRKRSNTAFRNLCPKTILAAKRSRPGAKQLTDSGLSACVRGTDSHYASLGWICVQNVTGAEAEKVLDHAALR